MSNLTNNFAPIQSAKITTSGTSGSITFSAPATGDAFTYFVDNTNATNGAYLAWGNGAATAVASSGTPAANCVYIPPATTRTFTSVFNTIAAIQSGGAAVLEISIGYGS